MKQSKTKFGECSHLSATQKNRVLETLGKKRLEDIDRVLTKFHQSSNIYIKKYMECSFMYIIPIIYGSIYS